MVHSHLESIKWFICLGTATSVASGVVRSEMQAGLAARVSLGQQKVCFPATWGVMSEKGNCIRRGATLGLGSDQPPAGSGWDLERLLMRLLTPKASR